MLLLSVIIGTVIWVILLQAVLNKFEIFATPWAIFMSWFVVCMVVFNILGGISSSIEKSNYNKEASKMEGSWKSSDYQIGIRALMDDGNAMYLDEGGFGIAVYDKNGSPVAVGSVIPKTKTIRFEIVESGESVCTYKLKGLFFKKMIIINEKNEQYKFTRKSKDWMHYFGDTSISSSNGDSEEMYDGNSEEMYDKGSEEVLDSQEDYKIESTYEEGVLDRVMFPLMSLGYNDENSPCAVMLQAWDLYSDPFGTYDEMLLSCEEYENVLYAPPAIDEVGMIYTAAKWDAYPEEWTDGLLTYEDFISKVNYLAGIDTSN